MSVRLKRKNWRTTLIGTATAAGGTAISLIQTGEVNWTVIGLSAGIAALGWAGKDAGVEGPDK